jgi:hypothetical protein
MSILGDPTSDDMVTVHVYDSEIFENSFLENLETVSIPIQGSDLNNLKVYIDHNNNCTNNSNKTNSPNSLNNNDISEK